MPTPTPTGGTDQSQPLRTEDLQVPDFDPTEGDFQSIWESGVLDTEDGTTPKNTEIPDPNAQTQDETQNQTQDQNQEKPEGDEPPTDEAPTDETPPDDGEDLTTLDDFLAENKIAPEDFNKLTVRLKADGQDYDVPLSELTTNWQLRSHVQTQIQQNTEQRKAFEAETNQVREVFAKQLAANENLGKLALDQINYEFNQINWQELQQEDPGRAALLYQTFQQRQGEINQYMQQIANQQNFQAEQQKELQKQQDVRESQILLDAIPEWRDASVRRAAQESIIGYAKDMGFTDAELGDIHDNRIMQVLHDAARYRALQAKSPQVSNQVRQAPKMVRPGTRVNKNPQQARIEAAKERLKRNPRDLDAQAALFEQFG